MNDILKKKTDRTGLIEWITKIIHSIIKFCKRKKESGRPRPTVDWTQSKYVPSQLIVWKRPGVSQPAFDKWKKDNLPLYGNVQVKKLCFNCDDSLELWEGDNLSTFISEKVAGSGTSNPSAPPSGGGDDIACYSYNFIIDLPETEVCAPEQYKDEIISSPAVTDGEAITIAVFDTGIIPAIKALYTEKATSCIPDADFGWNFAYGNNNTDDDYPTSHGSVVTKFIIDQANNYKNQKINILPVKVHNSAGKSDLISILCAFAYAAHCGAKIINASFGFYASKDAKAPIILAEFVKKYLTEKNILLIAAAGNVNQDRFIGSIDRESVRNLEINPFYPACLAKDFENVIAVTTISNSDKQVSPSQNFSNKIVDIGTNCDDIVGGDYRFKNPFGRPVYVLGSSYATPIVTGIISQHYTEFIGAISSSNINKNILIQNMKNKIPKLIAENPPLSGHIKDGNFCLK